LTVIHSKTRTPQWQYCTVKPFNELQWHQLTGLDDTWDILNYNKTSFTEHGRVRNYCSYFKKPLYKTQNWQWNARNISFHGHKMFGLISFLMHFNTLTLNDPYWGRTAPLNSKRCILYIYSANIGTEHFKHGINSLFFSSKWSFFHNSKVFGSRIIHILYIYSTNIGT
jgi:hypothetical protein